MPRIFLFVLCLTLLKEANCLSVLSYNIQHGLDVHKVFNLSGTVETIKNINPDLIGLQEGNTTRDSIVHHLQWTTTPTERRTTKRKSLLTVVEWTTYLPVCVNLTVASMALP
jgi:endonuclease/exonuclease/phosphatase family metal-dependent hydrolase